jgi:hypothetical protein
MFQTYKDARDPLMSAIAGVNADIWTSVTFTSFQPIFLITYQMLTPEGELRRSALLNDVNQVVEMLQINDKGFFVDELQILTPSHLNDSVGWKLEPLREVSQGVSDKYGPTFFYKLENGGVYFDAPDSDEVEIYRDVKRKFTFCGKE